MSEDQKIIEHEGVKYYKKEGQWHRLVPIEEDKVPATKKCKLNLQPEILFDIFKFLNFVQLLAVQETNFYFKNFIDKYGKELARKKYEFLFFVLYCEFQDQGHKFVGLEPNDFQLSEQLEEKWKRAIEESIPMFLTWPGCTYELGEEDIVVCDLGQGYVNEFDDFFPTKSYCLHLPWIPKSIEDMKIARSLFQLLFNCAFEMVELDFTVINPQMIQLLFDEDKTNMPLQIHSQRIVLFPCGNHVFDLVLNHLFSKELKFYIDNAYADDVEEKLDVVFKILANGGNKISMITCQNTHSKFYNFIIKVCKK
ncbi:unnamed protein product [Meloidogyne enterolobii]|uniref:Uncharacterized protein n=1 Tax=Meloidogyne enterolobii TaxID=390850 RepID=A0ACB1AQC5_MELEN